MTFTSVSRSSAETRLLGERLAGWLKPNDVLLLSGDLGAGKTEFSKGVAVGLGIGEAVASPTFNLMLAYQIGNAGVRASGGGVQAPDAGQLSDSGTLPSVVLQTSEGITKALDTNGQQPHSLYHFDLYRLDSSDQLDDLDYFGLLEDGAVSVVEWGDRFVDAMPDDYLLVTIVIQNDESRQLIFQAVGKRSEQLLQCFQAIQE